VVVSLFMGLRWTDPTIRTAGGVLQILSVAVLALGIWLEGRGAREADVAKGIRHPAGEWWKRAPRPSSREDWIALIQDAIRTMPTTQESSVTPRTGLGRDSASANHVEKSKRWHSWAWQLRPPEVVILLFATALATWSPEIARWW
jgi:hypothetical protein